MLAIMVVEIDELVIFFCNSTKSAGTMLPFRLCCKLKQKQLEGKAMKVVRAKRQGAEINSSNVDAGF